MQLPAPFCASYMENFREATAPELSVAYERKNGLHQNVLQLCLLVVSYRFREHHLECDVQVAFLVALVQGHAFAFEFPYLLRLSDTL